MAYCTADDVMAVLRLTTGDVDASRVAAAVADAAVLIDAELGYTVPLPDPGPRAANVRAAVALYWGERAPGGFLGIADPAGPVTIPADPLAGCAALLDPWRRFAGFGGPPLTVNPLLAGASRSRGAPRDREVAPPSSAGLEVAP